MQGFGEGRAVGERAIGRQADRADRPGVAGARRLASDELFAGAREVIIDHVGDLYRLRCTSKGKLILTK
jgi:hemin uptake protein HemP